ncbi:MAG: hypothetical protein ABIQ40_05970 [Bacteroidia bacterium]
MEHSGFFYTLARLFYKFFHALEWTYNHITPNKIFIVLLFLCVGWWLTMQHNYNKKAAQNGTYK